MSPLLLSVFPTFAVGGAQMRFVTLANRLGRNWRHAIVSMDGVVAARALLDPGLEVSFPPIEIRKGDTAGNVRRFRGALQSWRPRTILTHNFGSIEWSIANRPLVTREVHVEDGFGPEERDRQIRRRVWLRRLFLRGRTVALPSRTLMRLARDTWRLPAAGLHYVPNGIDLVRFAQPAPAPPWPVDLPTVGTVAALRPEKNLERLLRAFALASQQIPARLVIVGDGPERARLEQLAATMGIADRVWFTGYLFDPAGALGALDLFALSSDTEQMPISLLEAMAAGRAVVSTDVGDVSEMLPAEQRDFVVGCDDLALGQAISALLGAPARRAALGARNRERAASEFSLDQMVARWASLLGG